jgi:competence protein ComGF
MRIKARWNEKGITLIELIISLAIILAIAALVPLLIKAITFAGKESKGTTIEETEMFFTDIGKEIRVAKEVGVSQQQLVLKAKNGDILVFSFYQGRIRKQVNGTGHEIWLQNTASFTAENNGRWIILKIVDFAGKKAERSYLPLQWGI